MLRWDERSNPIFKGKEHPRKCFFLFIPGVCPMLSLSLCSQTPPTPRILAESIPWDSTRGLSLPWSRHCCDSGCRGQ